MINASETILTMLNSPLREIRGKVELDGSTYLYTDKLKSFTVDRTGEQGKFFGFGISQKLTLNLLDKDREITPANEVKAFLGVSDEYVTPFPTFYVDPSETKRDEKTNELTIVAYDALRAAASIKISEVFNAASFESRNSTYGLAMACASYLGIELGQWDMVLPDTEITEENPFNYEGTETIKDILDDIAEANGSIYYINNENKLCFKVIERNQDIDFTIDKNLYFELESKSPAVLAGVASATSLGDNVEAKSETIEGITQYIRDNGITVNANYPGVSYFMYEPPLGLAGAANTPFSCSWRGNFLLEPLDKIALITKDDETIISFLLNDTLTYNGALSQKTVWSCEDNQEESFNNPVTLGEALKQTYAKVDKVNKQIELVASETGANSAEIASIKLNTESIDATVQKVIEDAEAAKSETDGKIADLTQSVEAKLDAEKVSLIVKEEINENGVNKVSTATGFTFDETGLTVEKTGSEMRTQITEDGMTVAKDNEVVLTANNVGVNAKNLHATTYLIVGNNSRFEDYDGNRTGCFWVGG